MKARQILDNFKYAKQARETAGIDDVWQILAERVRPSMSNIQNNSSNVSKSRYVLDSTASEALPKFASALKQMIMPPGEIWQRIKCSDENLNIQYKEWFGKLTNRVFIERYRTGSNFKVSIYNCFRHLGLFGASPISVLKQDRGGLFYKNFLPRDVYCLPDNYDRLTTVFRTFECTKEQAIQQFGDNTPKKILESSETTKTKYTFIYAVSPATPEQKKEFGKEFYTVYVSEDCEDQIIEESGASEQTLIYPIIDTQDNTWYGYSPCMQLYPDIKMINNMERANLRTAQKMGDTSYKVNADEVINPLSLGSPNSVIYGGISPDGKDMVKEMETGNRALPYSLEQQEQKRGTIKRGLLYDLFQILVDSPQKTATQVLEEAQEKGSLVGPYSDMLQEQLFNPVTLLELDILLENNQYPEGGEEVIEAIKSGKVWFTFEYDNPISNVGKAQRGIGLQRTLELATVLANAGSMEALGMINIKRAMTLTAEAYNAPVDVIFNTPEEQEEINQAAQEQAQMQQVAEGTQIASQAEKDLSQAEKNKAAARAM